METSATLAPDSNILKAIQELARIGQDPEEYERFLAQRQHMGDVQSQVNLARQEGFKDGFRRGLYSIVRILEQILRRRPMDSNSLEQMDWSELDRFIDALKAEAGLKVKL